MGDAQPEKLDFGGRFSLRREIGRGGMGIVYAAYDRERKIEVALKRLDALEPTSLYRFKREFRALADLSHPNLVTLYELRCEQDQWFFTMELVDGVDFITYVLGADARPHARPGTPDAPTGIQAPASRDVTPAARSTQSTALPDLGRLRAGFRQLAEGLCALHASERLHRDIKPSNVLVTPTGRVVVLDFGVIAELAGRGSEPSECVGTPLYMAPEQAAADAPLSPASDWYGAGVMLYEALTGRRPFEGDAAAVLRAKQERQPLPPRARLHGVPPDLDDLCVALLRIRADERPSGPEVLARLMPACAAPTPPPPSPQSLRLFGRDAHREVLREAFSAARSGHGQMLLVHGASGVGKSELVQRFVDELEAGGEALVLRGRCFERESVPFKGVDSLVDALANQLLRLPRAAADALMPDDVDALGRLLPVLRRVEAIAQGRPSLATDPHELRRRAFRALRELFTRLAQRQPTVLFIDDLQWGDADSGAVLADLMQPPDPPPLLVIGAYRTNEAAQSPLLRMLWRREERLGPASRMRRLAVGPLDPDDAWALALGLLERSASGGALAGDVVREADGNPYLIHELARFAADFELGFLGSLQLQDVVVARLARLPDDARRLLEVIAAAGQPISQGAARTAARDATVGSIEVLRGHRLVRTHGSRDRDLVEPFHDRIRESVVAALRPDSLQEVHRLLATSLEAAREGDAQTLGEHWERAGDRDRAAGYYEKAAATAAESLAFDRAADLYARVVEIRPESAALETRLGDALANAGRCPAAAAAYRRAADGSDGEEAMVLRARAATELLRSGHVDEGLDELTPALAKVGLQLVRRSWRGLLSMLARRVRIRLRGLRYRERATASIPKSELARIDLCWGAACGLACVDLVSGAEMQTRHLLWALRAGDPFRVGRALICELGYHAVQGPRAERRVARILAALEDTARRSGEPALRGYLQTGRGLAAYQFGRWQAARDLGDEAERIFRDAGAWWEVTTTRLYLLWSRYYLGETAELSRRVPAFLADAEARGDRLMIASLSTGLPHQRWLLRDDPDEGERVARAAMQAWSQRSYFLQHFWYGFAESQSHLYRGDGALALARIQRDWPALERSLLLQIALIRVEALDARGRAALGAAARSPADRDALLRLARRDALRMARVPTPLGPVLAELLLAGVDALRGDRDRATARLRRAIDECRRSGLGLHRRAAEWQLGRLVGGDEGCRLVDEAGAAMRAQEIVSPARTADLLAPGIAS